MHRNQVSTSNLKSLLVLFFFILIVFGIIFYLYINQLKIENKHFQYQISELIHKIEDLNNNQSNQENNSLLSKNIPDQEIELNDKDSMIKEHSFETNVLKSNINILDERSDNVQKNISIQQKKIRSAPELSIVKQKKDITTKNLSEPEKRDISDLMQEFKKKQIDQDNELKKQIADEYRYQMMEHLNRGQYFLESDPIDY